MAHFAQWMKNPQISAVIWSSEENIQLLLEVLRQASSVPITESTTIRAAVGMMKSLFMVRFLLVLLVCIDEGVGESCSAIRN